MANTCSENSTIQTGDRVLRRREVIQRTGLSYATIWRGMKAGTFPQCFPIGAQARGWLSSEIDAWIADRASQRGEAA